MNTPVWYEQSESGQGTIDLDAYEAAAQPSRRRLVEQRQLLPVDLVKDGWQTRRDSDDANRGFFTVDVDGKTFAPAFFIDTSIEVSSLAEVTGLLGNLPGWSKWHFMTAKNTSLGGITPLEALKRGEVERVRRAARAYAES